MEDVLMLEKVFFTFFKNEYKKIYVTDEN